MSGESYSPPCKVYSQRHEFLQQNPRDDHLFRNHTFLCCLMYLAGCLMASHLKHSNYHDKKHKLTKQEVIRGAPNPCFPDPVGCRSTLIQTDPREPMGNIFTCLKFVFVLQLVIHILCLHHLFCWLKNWKFNCNRDVWNGIFRSARFCKNPWFMVLSIEKLWFQFNNYNIFCNDILDQNI
jgi:hypothetical protein